MFKNYLKIAARNFLKYKAYSFINIAGLAIGIACCILILLYVQDELSYDRYHQNAEQIYRVVVDENDEGRVRRRASSFIPMAPALAASFPEISRAVRVFPRSVTVALGREKIFQEDRFFLVDSTFFEVFSFNFLQGNAPNALTEPAGLIITAATAKKYFGAENAVGKILTIDNRNDFKIVAVVENIPANSHFEFDFLTALRNVDLIVGRGLLRDTHQTWHWPPVYTYIVLPPNYAAATFESRVTESLRQLMPKRVAAQRSFTLQKLTDIHLRSDREEEIAPTGNIAYVYIFSAIAAFILLIACINFMNLATARAAGRAREVGLRKVIGAQRLQLIKQFLGESLFYTVLALLLALALVELLMPSFNTFVGKQIVAHYFSNWNFALGLLGLTFLVALLAGIYPAFFLARFRPVQAFQSKSLAVIGGRAPLRLRAILVVAQFAISITLIVVTAAVQAQLQFIQKQRLGFNKNHIVVLPIRDEAVQSNFAAIKNSLLAQTGVAQATAISNFPWENGYYDFRLNAEGLPPETQVNMPTLLVDYDFIHTFGMELVAGRDFSREHATDAKEAFILNEAAAHKLGWSEAIGKRIKMSDVAAGRPFEGRVIGVVKNFHLRSLHHEIEPLVMLIAPATFYLDNLAIRIDAQNIPLTLTRLEQKWHEVAPLRPFEYFFLDEAFGKLYRKEQKLAEIFQYFSALAIFVGCLGVFGLASFVAQQKTKEIGIRKVLGASVAGLVGLMSKDFVKLVLAANFLAWPVAYFAMNRWLQDFAYRINLSVEIFFFSGLLALGIALLTVSFQAIKAALTNPVEVLRYE